MINRVLIRTKVVQLLYSYLLTKDETSLKDARESLNRSLDEGYLLYHAIFAMIIDLTSMQDLKLDYAKNKYLPSEEDLNPNIRFVDNEFVKSLVKNIDLKNYLKDYPISWKDEVAMHIILNRITSSQLYEDYMNLSASDYATDALFWRDVLRKIVFEDDDFVEFIESKSIFWNDDLPTVGAFVCKTIKKWAEGGKQELLPMYKDKEDSEFAAELFNYVVVNHAEYDELINSCINTESWDINRVAFMDRVILLTAVAEFMNYPKVPSSVTLNEYIELAKEYGSPKSGIFVNGVLDALFKKLKSLKNIIKE
ncbi:MAG: transcription antitermination factor NusB [Muribaculaceae bacterium]|nr:transcription antitermination factor NusB [Muribaculaceae bacterium]